MNQRVWVPCRRGNKFTDLRFANPDDEYLNFVAQRLEITSIRAESAVIAKRHVRKAIINHCGNRI